MIAGWMFYFTLVSALLLGAGILLEEGARRIGRPARGIWAAALAASVLVPLLTRARPQPAPSPPGGSFSAEGITSLAPAFAVADRGSGWRLSSEGLASLDPLLLAGWAGATGVLLLIGFLSVLRLRLAMREWSELASGSRRILVSESTGPAVVGLLGDAIVLPRWAVSADSAVRDLMLSHEEEHLRARDPVLLLAATLLAVLLPWNLPLWWQLRRLRLAVEVDCDARVLGRGSDVRSYATLLMEVGRRRAALDPALLAFAEPASFLERRIRIMTSGNHNRGWLLAALCAAFSTVLIAGACSLDQPADRPVTDPPLTGPDRVVDVQPAAVVPGSSDTAGAAEVSDGAEGADSAEAADPSFTPRAMELEPGVVPEQAGSEPGFSPRDVEPELRNRAEFSRALEDAYPSVLREAGIGGTSVFWVRVDDRGGVTDVRVFESSGNEQIDAAARRALRTARFSPAEHDGSPVAVWIALPVTMSNSAPAARSVQVIEVPPAPVSSTGGEPLPPPPAGPLAQAPAFTPREVEPELRNRTEFGRAMERAYPPALKNAGIGGRVTLWVFVSETGEVGNVRLFQSSGFEELDAAAAETMRIAQFSPAMNRGNPVPVWISMPVVFQTNR